MNTENLISFRGAYYVDCTDSRQYISDLEWADRWMEVESPALPGTLTHEKIVRKCIESACALIDFQRFDV